MDIAPSDIDVEINGTYRDDVTFRSNSTGQRYLRSILEEDPFISAALQSCPYKTPLIQISVRQLPSTRKSSSGSYLLGLILMVILLLLFVTGLITIITGKNQ